MKALFIMGYPYDTSPAQRFRCEQWLRLLPAGRIDVHFEPLMNERSYSILYEPGHIARKMAAVAGGALKRLSAILRAGRFDVCFVGREAFPFGPAFIEALLERRVPVVYDFDDAIFIGDVSAANRSVARFKMPQKVARIVELATVTVAGNAWLAEWARQHTNHVEVLPTTIDIDQYQEHVRPRGDMRTLGWSGSKTTIPHLHLVDGALRKAVAAGWRLSVIGDRQYTLDGADSERVRAKDWSSSTELDDLYSFDIGLMPLPDDDWAKGKCGLKALQYMATGIPAVVSPVGVNTEIVEHGVNGLVASTEGEWVAAMDLLAGDIELRLEMGRRARTTVVEKYSGQQWAPRFLSVLESATSVRV